MNMIGPIRPIRPIPLRILKWIEDRWPLSSIFHLTVDEEIPGGPRYAYTDGSAILIIFALQVVTGVMQLFFYVPALDHAYDSLGYLRTEAPFGWLIHGFHYWGAQLMVIAVVIHMIRAFIWGAYKKPRELLWLAGVFLLLTTMAFSFTGAPLPWDQSGYWAGEVGTSIAGTMSLIGDFVKRLLRGGEQMGQLTLSRLFTAHVAILPMILVALFGIHYIAFRRFGSIGPWNETERKTAGPFWPDQAFKDGVVVSAIFFLLIALSVFAPPRFSGPADILDISYVPKPEWNFLFLYQALKYFQGPLEPLGTIGVPTVFIALLILLPFIDRNPERDPFRRPFALLCGLIYMGALIALTLIGYYSPGIGQAPAGRVHAEAEEAPAAKGRQPAPAPRERTSPPPPVLTRTAPGKAAFTIGSASRGEALFRSACFSCHGPEGTGNVPNPGSREGMVPQLNQIHRDIFDTDPRIFAANVDRFVQHGSVPAGKRPSLSMPAFGDENSLTQQEIANIEAYVLKLNGVDRAELVNPGMQPRKFFLVVAAVYVLVLLVQGGIRIKRNIS